MDLKQFSRDRQRSGGALSRATATPARATELLAWRANDLDMVNGTVYGGALSRWRL